MNKKLIIVFIFTILIIFTGTGTIFAADNSTNTTKNSTSLSMSPQNSALVSSNSNSGLVPLPIDFSYLKNMVTSSSKTSTVTATSIPSSYDLRTQGKVTSVKNQGSLGTCWAFATYGSLESSQLPTGSYDFSENNMKNLLSNSYPDGYDRSYGDGGNYLMSTAYLARWSGPVNESADPYNESSGISPSGLTVGKHIQEVNIIPGRTGSTDNSSIKQAIMTYGAVYTTMYMDTSYFNSSTNSYYYYYYFVGSSSNHAVCIVGWDDNYSKYNFKNGLFIGNGAFIVKNSWGTGWGDGGYFYVSYYDRCFGYDGSAVFYNAEATTNYNKIYQYDPLGWTSSVGYGTTTAWGSNVFTSTGNDKITAVSTYISSNSSTYQLYIYLNPTTDNPTSGTLATYQSGTISSAGYKSITLNTPVTLINGQKFSVVLQLTTPGYNYPLPMETPIANYSSKATASAGQSYISSNGTSWSDITSPYANTNICIKAFTIAGPQLTITSADPANGATNVALNKKITITFNNNIQAGTAYNNISVTSPNGTVTFNPTISGSQLILTPTANWTPNTTYTINIPTNAITDINGNTLTTNYTSNYTTGAQFAVTSTDPANGASNVALNKKITITFNNNIQAGTAYNNISVTSPNGTATFNPSISGNLLILTPSNFWTPNTTYTINLPYNALTDSNGNTLTTNYTSTFNTGSGLIINSVDPTSGTTNVALNKKITITFNNNIQAGTAYNNISVTSPNGTATFNPSISGNLLILTPSNFFSPNTTYTVNIPYNAVTDSNGNTLTTNHTSTFNTGSGLIINSVEPANGATNVALNKKITITFNNNIQAGTAYNNISVTSPNGTATFNPSINGSQLTLTPAANWTANTTYTVNIPYNALTDSNGNTLTTNYTSTFTTTPGLLINSVDPTSGATNVPLNKKVTITFNNNIQPGTAYNNISVTSASGSATVNPSISGSQLTLIPTANWTPNTTYTINIPINAITDANANTLTTNYTSTFTTGPQFAVTSADPTNGAVNVALNKKITINFNYTIQAGSAYNNISVTSPSGSATVNPSISGSQLILTPTSNWTPNTTYTINIPYNAVTDTNTNTLTTNYTSTFTTTSGISVNSVDPTNGATKIPLNKKITITFNQNIQSGPAYNSITITSANGTATFNPSISGSQLILTPTSNWTPNTTYTINIPYNAVTDTNGNTLTTNYTSTFTTGPQFAVTSIDTSSATTSKKIIITFNYDIKEGAAYNNINVYKYLIFPATITKTISGNQLILTSNNWTANAIYSIKIPYNAVTDTNGNTLTSNYSTTFII